MGTSLSRYPRPPLVEISGQDNNVLVPAGTCLTVNPFPSPTSPFEILPRGLRPKRTPIYRRIGDPFPFPFPDDGFDPRDAFDPRDELPPMRRGGGRGRGRGRASPFQGPGRGGVGRDWDRERPGPRGRRGPGREREDFETESVSESFDGSSDRRGPGGPGGMMRDGMGGPGGGRRPSMQRRDMGDGRMRSVPNLGMGRGMAYPGQGMGMGMGKYGPESEGDMNGIGGMGAPGNMPYGMVQPRPQQMMQRPPPQQRQSYPPPGVHEIAGGAYATRAHTAPPPVSRQVNRAQANNAKVGPSGQEWLGGDPFLDACTCTTNCTCRKGQRVLYRAKGHMEGEEDGYEGDGGGGGGGGTGGNGNGGGGRNAWGEIRYVLKEDVGRDCGDHSGCKEKKKKKSKKRSKGRIKDESDSSEEQTKNIRKEVIKELQAQLGDFHREHNGGRMPPQMPFSPGTGLHPNLAVMDPTMQQLQQQQLQHQQLQQQQQQLQQQYLQQTLPPNVGGGGRHNLNSFPPGMYPMNMAGIPGEDYDEGTSVYGYPRDYVDMSQQRERHRPRRNRHAPPPEYMDPRRPPRRGGGGGRRGPPPMGRGMMGGRGRGGRRGPSPFEDDEDEYYPPPPPRGSRSGYGDEEVDEDGDWDDDDEDHGRTGRPGMQHHRGSPSGRGGRRMGSRSMGPRGGACGPPGRQARVDDADEDDI